MRLNVFKAWNNVYVEIIIKSYKVTRISNKIDGSEKDVLYEDIDSVSADFNKNSSSYNE